MLSIVKPRQICRYLRELISPVDFGVKILDPKTGERKPVHANSNAKVLASYASQYLNLDRKVYRESLPLWRILDHLEGHATLYAGGNESPKADKSLFMFDIDAEKRRHGKLIGTREGARQCAEYLKTKYPDLYIEPSTNGVGFHGYGILTGKAGLGSKVVNELLKRLHQQLRKECIGRFDIADIEIKMTLPVKTWGEEKNNLLSYTASQLGKLPRQLLNRFDEFTNTTTFDVMDLRRLPPVERSKPTEKPTSATGSTRGTCLDIERLAACRVVAERMMGKHQLRTTSRVVATSEHLAILLLILWFCYDNPNADGGMPTERIKTWWDMLYADGSIDSGWSPQRYTALRNYLDELTQIDWINRSYTVGEKDHEGKYHKGKAACWGLTAGLVEQLRQQHEALSPDCSREREPCIITDLDNYLSRINRKTPEDVIKPEEMPKVHLLPDLITELIGQCSLAA